MFPALQLAAAPDLPSPPWQQFSSQRSNTDTSQEKMLRRAVGSRARGIQGDLSRPRCRAQHGVAGDGAKSKNCHHQLQKITGERNFPRAWTRLQALVLRSSQKSQGQVCRAGERLRLGAPKLGGWTCFPTRGYYGSRSQSQPGMLRSLCSNGGKKRRGVFGSRREHPRHQPRRDPRTQAPPAGRSSANKVGAPRGWVFGSPPAVHHYLHEDPKEQSSHPDLDGELPHGATGVAPAAAAGAVRGSHGSAGAARLSLGGEGGALQAAGGGGRRARGGGGGEGSAPTSRSGLPDTQTPRH